jgi:hypothetical protein
MIPSALLFGFALGGSITEQTPHPTSAHFIVGAGLDWLFEDGLVVQSRLEATHQIDTTLAIGVGFAGAGLRSNEGLPLGISVLLAGQLDRDQNPLAGARAQIAYGLWYSRAVLELDVTMLEAVTREARYQRGAQPEVAVGLVLRFVPWPAWIL